MSEDSTARDLVGLVRGECQAATRYGVGAAIASYASDAAREMPGLGTTCAGAACVSVERLAGERG